MNEYEIRITRSSFATKLIWAAPHPSTYSALCKVRDYAGQGDVLEVWRGTECVHREVVGALPDAGARE